MTVLDASVVGAWAFSDERSDDADRLLDEVAQRGAVVPSHWPIETANLMLTAARRNRLTAPERDAFLRSLLDLPIRVVEVASHDLFEILVLADQCRLTAYDAGYLWLAVREHLPLATKDDALIRAAQSTGTRLRSL